MEIREYRESDLGDVVKLFYDTVHNVNIRDYTSEQVDAWATGYVDMVVWNTSFKEHYTLVACEGPVIIGFGDIDANGYLDRLYVHHKYQRRGVASALCDILEFAVDAEKIVVHASVTAKPFFERRGYKVLRKQLVDRMGVMLPNYLMVLTKR